MTRQIAIYGKGGIGKSMTTQNLAASLAAHFSKKVMVVGCDPKSDSTRLLMGRMVGETVLDALRETDEDELALEDIRGTGFAGVTCGLDGLAVGVSSIASITMLEQLGAYEEDLDYVFYDVLGDVVCGGFAMPIREGKAQEIYVVASGELMSLYAANNICKGILRYARSGGARLAGVICNSRNVAGERELVSKFAEELGSKLISFIPRDGIVQKAEISRKTVIEYAPESNQAAEYDALAARVEENAGFCIPTPLSQERLEQLMIEYGM